MERKRVPLSSTHQFHTKVPLLFSPPNPSVPHQKHLSSTLKNPQFNTPLRQKLCWTKGFLVWNWGGCETVGFFVWNWGRLFLNWGILMLNWGVFSVEYISHTLSWTNFILFIQTFWIRVKNECLKRLISGRHVSVNWRSLKVPTTFC